MKKVCEGCGSKYELVETKIMIRDKDSIDCKICGTTLIEWNGACIWNAKLIEDNSKKE